MLIDAIGHFVHRVFSRPCLCKRIPGLDFRHLFLVFFGKAIGLWLDIWLNHVCRNPVSCLLKARHESSEVGALSSEGCAVLHRGLR